MLTEGWDCNTVTHIIGLRPFMSQLLCEQVVGRGLRRRSYEVGEDGKLRRKSPRSSACRSRSFRSSRPKPAASHAVKAVPRPCDPGEGGVRNPFPRVEGYQPGDPQPGDGGLGRTCRHCS